MKNPDTWDVYLVTDRRHSMGRSTAQIVEAAIRGGISVVQLREKDLNTRDFFLEGQQIKDLLDRAGVPLIINDRIDVALALDADGVHLGPSDMPLPEARRILGPTRILGFSAEKPEHLQPSLAELVDYFAISPVFFTQTKDDIVEPWGLDGLQRARRFTGKPLVAIGGLKYENSGQAVKAGADSVAVITAITAADDPELATRDLVALVRSAKSRKNIPGAP